MTENGLLQKAGYAMALTLAVIPLSEVLLAVIPFRVLDTQWRVGSIGIFTEALMTPLLGLSIATAVAVTAQHPRAVRAIGVVSAVLAGLLVVAAGVFLLDSMRTRVQVRPEALTSFDAATIQAVVKMALSTVVLGLIGAGILMDDRSGSDVTA